MPKVIDTIKADPIGSQTVPDTQINVSSKVPSHKTLPEARRFYYQEALKLEKALYESLPGGLYDALEKRDNPEKEQITQLRELLHRVEVTMDTLALKGIRNWLEPQYCEDWAMLHIDIQDALEEINAS